MKIICPKRLASAVILSCGAWLALAVPPAASGGQPYDVFVPRVTYEQQQWERRQLQVWRQGWFGGWRYRNVVVWERTR